MKIESKELMIGNFVNLTKDNFKTVKPYMMEGVDIYKVDKSDCYDIQPITLTEDWLLKFGFFKFNNAYVLEKPIGNPMEFKFSIWHDMTYNSSEFPIQLKYVHQLQNLFFALTGKELQVK